MAEPRPSSRVQRRGARRWRAALRGLRRPLLRGPRRAAAQRRREGFELAGVPAARSATSRSPAPSSCPSPPSCCAETGELRRRRLPRRRHPRRDRPLRLRLRRGRPRHPGRPAGDRRPLRLRRDHLRHDGAGPGPGRRRQARPGPQRRPHRRPHGPAQTRVNPYAGRAATARSPDSSADRVVPQLPVGGDQRQCPRRCAWAIEHAVEWIAVMVRHRSRSPSAWRSSHRQEIELLLSAASPRDRRARPAELACARLIADLPGADDADEDLVRLVLRSRLARVLGQPLRVARRPRSVRVVSSSSFTSPCSTGPRPLGMISASSNSSAISLVDLRPSPRRRTVQTLPSSRPACACPASPEARAPASPPACRRG